MSQFRDFGRDRDDDLPRPDMVNRPYEGLAAGAGLQAASQFIYVGSVLLSLLAVAIGVTAGPGEPAAGVFVVLAVAGLGFCTNWILSIVASAMLSFADTSARVRGVGLALLAFSVLVVLKLPTAAQFVVMGTRFGVFDGPMSREFASVLVLTFFLCELARLSLVGWYVAVAAPPGRRGLAGAGRLLGILTPVLAVLALLLTFLASVMASSGPGLSRRSGVAISLALALGNLAIYLFLLLFGAVLLVRLAGAAQTGRQRTEY